MRIERNKKELARAIVEPTYALVCCRPARAAISAQAYERAAAKAAKSAASICKGGPF